MKFKTLTLCTIVATLSLAWAAEDAAEIMRKSHLALYYAGNDQVTDVHMKIVDQKGKERVREFAMLRLDLEEGGDQRYYTYFKKPADVARMTFMVHKSVAGNDARWIYIPAVDLVKPVSADDKSSSFVGSDFSYEDVSGRHWSEDTHRLLPDSTIDGAAVYVVESTPKKDDKSFAKKLSYIDKATMLPLRERYFDKKGSLSRVFAAEKIDTANGITTVMVRSMEDVYAKRKTTVTFLSVSTNVGLKEEIFTERFLKSPPREFIK
ncbi:MAG TPA: outer membrane lipoprotein-sorting protein [Candidatus Deferrimicrobium sp.]|nr:outer membrane lipoprotein-sorting protein [Candidatus Deferrimicrobium sp.]